LEGPPELLLAVLGLAVLHVLLGLLDLLVGERVLARRFLPGARRRRLLARGRRGGRAGGRRALGLGRFVSAHREPGARGERDDRDHDGQSQEGTGSHSRHPRRGSVTRGWKRERGSRVPTIPRSAAAEKPSP